MDIESCLKMPKLPRKRLVPGYYVILVPNLSQAILQFGKVVKRQADVTDNNPGESGQDPDK